MKPNKKKTKKKAASAPPTPAEESKDRSVEKQRLLIRALVSAEDDGMVRAFLKGFDAEILKMDAKANGNYSSKEARAARDGRQAIVGYLLSIIGPLDLEIRCDLLNMLLWQIRASTKQEGVEDDPEFPREGKFDSRAVWAIMETMRAIEGCVCLLAQDGNERVAEELPFHAIKLVETLNELAKNRPELVRSVAAVRIYWPILATRHYPKESDFAALADRIGLASKSVVKPKKRHTWKPETPINKHILNVLLEGYGDGRELTKENVPYYLDKVLMPMFEKWAGEDGGWENCPEFAEIAHGAAKRGKTGVQRSEIRNRVKRVLKAFAG